LEFLDGVNGINHVLFLATTSDLSLVPDSLKKRPSRFDLKVEINLPSATDREYYFTTMIPENELKKIKLENWIKDTDGYTISHLQELITSYFIYGQTYKASISNIRKLINGGDKGIGFELADTLEQE
jgi:ATP-dependent 26S proteasome regulatory subunit